MPTLQRKPTFRKSKPLTSLWQPPPKHRIKAGVVRFVPDGDTWREMLCAPKFMYPQIGKVAQLPEGRYIVGSAAHADKRRGLGLEPKKSPAAGATGSVGK